MITSRLHQVNKNDEPLRYSFYARTHYDAYQELGLPRSALYPTRQCRYTRGHSPGGYYIRKQPTYGPGCGLVPLPAAGGKNFGHQTESSLRPSKYAFRSCSMRLPAGVKLRLMVMSSIGLNACCTRTFQRSLYLRSSNRPCQ